MAMEKFDQDKIKEIVKKHNLKLLLLFGSQVSGKTHPMSDFDFGFISEKELDYKQKSELVHKLTILAKFSDTEGVDLKKASPFLLKEIVKNNQIIFEKGEAYAEFFSNAVRIYFEAKPIFNLQKIIYSNVINKYRKEYAK
ncbi:MAG: nucleotidyltransferase domain-containing protein [bacterium]|nr:nucleotidyltransferase domain-containing protein [bacterium]